MKKLVTLKTASLYTLLLISISGCNPLPNDTPTPKATASASSSATPEETAAENTYTLYVNSQQVDCIGEAAQKCLQVRRSESESWGFFYDEIEGFTFEPGFVYTLKVSEEEFENPPADASSKHIKLEEVLSKTPSQAIAVP